MDAVGRRLTMATAIPRRAPDGCYTPQCLSTDVPTSTNTHHPPDKMYQSPAAPFCLALKSFVGHRAALSEATITPKIAIQDFGQERLWRKLWKNALKNDPPWELMYLLIMHLCISVPISFPRPQQVIPNH